MPMLHTPVNHHLRPLYRTLAALAGLYVLVFGVAGVVKARGLGLFAQHDLPWVLGLRTNLAFAILSIGAGLLILAGTIIGRNIDHLVNLTASVIFLATGLAMLALLRTDANFLGFSVSNCVASFILGIITGLAGLYGKVGSAEIESAEESFRHGSAAPGQSAAASQ
jgi:Domain of unknown function (DUF4383)